MSFLRQQSADEEYRVLMRLTGPAGPVNTLAFGPDAKFLASGGDDEKVRIWDVATKQIHQVIEDDLERWGQITCTQWLTGFTDNGNTLCFGTGRGQDFFKELSSTTVLPFNEPVEAMDYDKKNKLVLSSHGGKIKLFHVERNGTLIALWSKNWNDIQQAKGSIPRSVHFCDRGENIVIFGLESGVMLSKAAATGGDNWTKVLKSSIGNATFSTDQQWLLVDNLAKGFDLYNYPHSSPSDSFPVSRTKAFVQQGVFLENETSVACGSDHGYIHIFSLGTSKPLQTLKHGSAKTMVQVLDACSTVNQHLIASGTDEKKPVIYVWEKKVMSFVLKKNYNVKHPLGERTSSPAPQLWV
ncbi:hypothetical protein GALMADRAFT_139529 [Galerina marginata CBS 339.88]|uniref:Uncharacterized protein n=1 Tax=Galerina marginata (strain CBS 339.88) TaxID=685588 RepID=A0A067T0F0_GALM3|nr:hypothetical protein GALMADRAFT_139529 [Galerina marginata CBS 339.88]